MTKVYDLLTIKYRPRELHQVVGQDQNVQILINALKKNRIHQTYLISGPFGSGKTSVARCLARAVNCENRKGSVLCGKCGTCKIKSIDLHRDVEEINAASQRGIDDIRALSERSRFAPSTNFRVFILDECQSLTAPAWQAALKLLEEPTKSSIFMLITTAPEKLPKTILSRCFKVDLDPVKPITTAKLLVRIAKKEGFDLGKKYALRIAKAVRGHPRDALNVLEKVLISGKNGSVDAGAVKEAIGVPLDRLIALYLKAVLDGNLPKALGLLDHATETNVPSFLRECSEHLRQLLFHLFSPKVSDELTYGDFFKQEWRRNLKEAKFSTWATLIELYLNASLKAKEYSMEAGDLLSVVTLQALASAAIVPRR